MQPFVIFGYLNLVNHFEMKKSFYVKNFSIQGTPTNVDIGDHSKSSTESHSIGYVTGIQRWLVPATGIYT